MELPGALFKPKLGKKNLSQKSSLYFKKWNFLASRLKNFLYFMKYNFLALRLKDFLYFGKWNFLALYSGKWNFLALILKTFLCFLKRRFFLYFEKRKPQKFIFSGSRTFLYFRKLLIFHEVTFPARKMKRKTLLKSFLYS